VFKPLSIHNAADLAAFACLAELAADKPGNVSLRRGLPGLTPTAFLHSAAALRAAFSRRGRRSVGRLVLDTVRRTRRRVGTNTNLGLALILAPLAIAATRPAASARRRRATARRTSPAGARSAAPLPGLGREWLRRRLRATLRSLTRRDAEQVYEAIRLAHPAGMGKVAREDVRARPRRGLRACMALAQRRDSLAAEYARDYSITFEIGLPALERGLGRGWPLRQAAVEAFLTILAARPDSLICRKHGVKLAREVSRRARAALAAPPSVRAGTRAAAVRRRRSARAFDRWLRARRLNPGTTADLTATAIFAALASRFAGAKR